MAAKTLLLLLLQESPGRQAPSKFIDSFPLGQLLRLFTDGTVNNSGALAKRILEGYIWLSCQPIRSQPSSRFPYQSHSQRVARPLGPNILATASTASLVSLLCEKAGWKEYENVLLNTAEKLCLYGNGWLAAEFVERLGRSADATSEKSRVCNRMATIACNKILAISRNSMSSDMFKKLAKFIGSYCPALAPTFTAYAKLLDASSVLYPLVTDNALRAAANDEMKESLSVLANHCARALDRIMPSEPEQVKTFTIPTALYSNTLSEYSSFLRNPCKQVFDWQVRKSDHAGFLRDLGSLCRAGEVICNSYQPGGRGLYHFKIAKTKVRPVPNETAATVTCSCSTRQYSYLSHRTMTPNDSLCRLKTHKGSLAKYREDQNKLNTVRALLTPEQRSQLTSRGVANPYAAAARSNGPVNPYARSSQTNTVRNPYASSNQPATKKQKTSEVVDLLDGDDEIEIGGVLNAEQAIRKRVEAAERKGEVVEID